MRNFADTFKTRERSFISAFSICMNVPLKDELKYNGHGVVYDLLNAQKIKKSIHLYQKSFQKIPIIPSLFLEYQFGTEKKLRRSFNFEALRFGAYWRIALKKGRLFFQIKRHYSHEISNFNHFFFPNNTE